LRVLILLSLLLSLCRAETGDVTFKRLATADQTPAEWLTYWGDYHATRFRKLDQINENNVGQLRLAWLFQTGAPGAFETVPLVANGVMYFSTPDTAIDAIDARSGRLMWRYVYRIPKHAKYCCGTVNRGLAILGRRLFMLTPDTHLLAIDVRNGSLLWNVEVAPSVGGGYGGTEAPLVVKDKVVLGTAAGDYGIRGFLDAYDANTGKRSWRFWTVPSPGEPGSESWGSNSWEHGGAATWMTGTYDPELNTIYWGTGNPAPTLYGKKRPGDNLYSDSVLALDADTGHLKWYYQFTPHDTHDYDANETPMLLDLPWHGRTAKLLVQANRNGFFYVLDRETGKFLFAKAFVKQTWAKDIDHNGRPIVASNTEPTTAGTLICPQCAGGTNWMAPSYNPATGLFYVNVREGCDIFFSEPPAYQEGANYWATMFRAQPQEHQGGRVTALDPVTGETKWTFPLFSSPWAGTLTTAGNLVFAGDEDGYLIALQADTGKLLWRVNTGAGLRSSPITYAIEGKQYLSMPSGGAILTFALP